MKPLSGMDASFLYMETPSQLAHVVGSLSAAGAVVLTMRLPDPGRMLGMPTALARPLGGRIGDLNQIMDQLAAQFGTLHFDAAEDSQVYDRCMWSVDRLHPSERGHRHIACRFHDQLAAHGHPVGPRPGTEPTSPPPTRRDEFTWMATKGTKWVLRRCTDLLPYLLAMAVRDCFRGPRQPEPATGGEHSDPHDPPAAGGTGGNCNLAASLPGHDNRDRTRGRRRWHPHQ